MAFRERLLSSWEQPDFLSVVLQPFSLLYRAAFAVNRGLYKSGIKARYRAPVPVIVVGNITVGGTGKTPLVIALVEALRTQGLNPAVISRGYGGNAVEYPLPVDAGTDADLSGDEPALIARRTQVPLCVGPDRRQSIEYLLRNHQIDVIISDDGLQHFALERDIEICIVDDTSSSTNRSQLPAGPYRESIKRLESVDFVVRHGAQNDGENGYAMNLSAQEPMPLIEDNSSQFDAAKPLIAVAGIGNPKRFFETCRAMGLDITPRPFADHHQFRAEDIDFDDQQVLMTEKDAVKCADFADHRHWYLPVSAKLSENFFRAVTAHQIFRK